MSQSLDVFSYELRFGVTGHRSFQNEAAVVKSISLAMNDIQKFLNRHNQINYEWTVISSLAKGADRIVAHEILNRSNACLEIILPVPVEVYQNDFSDSSDLDEFKSILNKPESVVTQIIESQPLNNEISPEYYKKAGYEVVNHCEFLIAVWDGMPARGVGGTSEIVQYALETGRKIFWIHSEQPEKGIKLLISKKQGKNHKINPFEFEAISFPNNIEDFSTNIHFFTRFATDETLDKESLKALNSERNQKIKSQAKEAEIPLEYVNLISKHLTPLYTWADQLSIQYQKQHERISKTIHYLSAFAVTAVMFQVTFFPEFLMIVSVEILAMISVIFALNHSEKKSWHENWMDYRYLSEQLRTLTYVLLLDINPLSTSTHPSKTLPYYFIPQNWIETVVSQIQSKISRKFSKSVDTESIKKFILEGWLKDQKGWHERNAIKKENAEHRIHNTVITFFVITLAMAILHLFGVGHEHEFHEYGHHTISLFSISNWIVFLAIILPAWGAAVHAISKQMEYQRIATRSKNMASELEKIIDLAESNLSRQEFKEIIHQAVRLTSLETHEWRALISFTKPEIVA